MDIAPLSFRVDSSGAVTAEGDLDELTAAAGRADVAQESLAASAGRAAAAETNMSAKAKAATAAVNAHTVAAKANTAAMNMQAASAGQVAARQQQMMFQTNDIAMSLASGQTPYIVAIQQGSQLAQVYGGPGGLNNAMGDFTKLMRGVIGTLVRFAPHLAATTALVTAGVMVYRDMTRAGRETEVALKNLEEIMADNVDVMADAHEYAQRIDLARIGREADDSVAPLDRMSSSLSRVAAALNDVVVARFIEEATGIGEQIRKLQEEIAVLDEIENRSNGRPSPSNTYSATGPLEFRLTEEQELRRRRAIGQLATLQREFQQMGRNVLSPDEARDFWGNLATGKFSDAFEGFSSALNGTLEPAKKTGRAIDEAARSMERLMNEAERYEGRRAKSQLGEIEYIKYQRDKEIEAIWEAAEEAKKAGNDVRQVNALADAAERDAITAANEQIADINEARAEQSMSRLQRGWDDLLRQWEREARDAEREARDRERLATDKTRFDRSLQPGGAMQQVKWWEDDQDAEAADIRDRELALVQQNVNEQERIWKEYENRKTEITRLAAQERRSIEAQQNSFLVGATAGMFDALSNLYGAYIDERSDGARTLFAIAKGLSLAQTTMDAYEAVGKAWTSEEPLPVKIAESIMAFTSVMNAVAGIQSVSYGGGREYGGGVRPDEFYEVNEKGKPELLNMGSKYYLMSGGYGQVEPAIRMPQSASRAGSAQALPPNIQIINNAPGVVVRKEGPEMNPRFIIEQAKAGAMAALEDDIAGGGGPISGLLEGQYGLNRGVGSR